MKMYCIISKESVQRFGGIRGKLMAQAGHAFLHSYWDSSSRFPKHSNEYMNSGAAVKITLIVDTDTEMIDLYDKYRKKCGATKVVDAGRTVFKEPTLTCVGIGPISENDIDDDLQKLKLFT